MQRAWRNINVNLYSTLIEKDLNGRDHFIDIDVDRWDSNISGSSGKNKSPTFH
jgi:hypothetical protein